MSFLYDIFGGSLVVVKWQEQHDLGGKTLDSQLVEEDRKWSVHGKSYRSRSNVVGGQGLSRLQESDQSLDRKVSGYY
jgi:hypothetical protein